MTTITGFTSARMLDIENNTVVSGTITGDDLILTKHGGATVNAGDVRGPVGPQGPIGEVTTAALNAAISGVDGDVATNAADIATNAADIATNSTAISDVEVLAGYAAARVPAGLVAMTMDASTPAGWLAIEGQSVSGADTLYPELWAAAPAGWKSGTTLNLPDMRGRVPVGQDPSESLFNTLEKTGGVTSVTLAKGNVPKHYHEMDHNHANATTTSNTHSHTINHNHAGFNTASGGAHEHLGIYDPYNGNREYGMQSNGGIGSGADYLQAGYTGNIQQKIGSNQSPHAHYIDVPNFSGSSGQTSHTHDVDLPNYTGNTEDGSETGLGSAAFTTVSPYFVLRFIVKT